MSQVILNVAEVEAHRAAVADLEGQALRSGLTGEGFRLLQSMRATLARLDRAAAPPPPAPAGGSGDWVAPSNPGAQAHANWIAMERARANPPGGLPGLLPSREQSHAGWAGQVEVMRAAGMPGKLDPFYDPFRR
jgi:hypothetical protein